MKYMRLGLVLSCMGFAAGAAVTEIKSGAVWPDEQGAHINAHGGGLLCEKDVWWWYGEDKAPGKAGNRAHTGVRVYSSRDFINWQNRGLALDVRGFTEGDLAGVPAVVERPKVMRNNAGKYVMYFHLVRQGEDYYNSRTGIAVADRPEGPFRFVKSVRPNPRTWPLNGRAEDCSDAARAAWAKYADWTMPDWSEKTLDFIRTGNIVAAHYDKGQLAQDQTLFRDDDGKVYHVYAAEFDATLHIAELTPDLLNHTGRWWRALAGTWTEAPALCRRNGWYYLLGSGCSGWKPNAARAFRAKSLAGPWEAIGNPCRGVNPQNGLGPEKTWGAQSTFLVPEPGHPGDFIALFDMWRPENAADGRYVWQPVTFTHDDKMLIRWRDAWRPRVPTLDFATSGQVTVGLGRYADPALAAKQLVAEADGLHVHFDADKLPPRPRWNAMGFGSYGRGWDWHGRELRLTFRLRPFLRCTKGMALNFVDRDGEVFQFLPTTIEDDLDRGIVVCTYRIDAKFFKGAPWGGGKTANKKLDAPLRLDSMNVHYFGDDGPGEVVFVKLEEAPPVVAGDRNVVSREPISLDTTYPGAKPFPGPEELVFRCTPAYSGRATVVLAYGSAGSVTQGAMKYVAGVFSNGVGRFETKLPYVVPYQYFRMIFEPAKDAPRADWKVVSGEGLFRQTANEALRFDVETGGRLLRICRSEKPEERPVITLRNPTAEPRRWTTTIKLRDVFQHKVEIPFDRTIAPGETVRVPVPWPLPAKGQWYAEVVLSEEGESPVTHRAQFAWIDLHEVTPVLEKPKFRFGIHWHSTHYLPDLCDPVIDAMACAGGKLARMDYGCMFGDIAKPDGSYDWSRCDDMLGRLRKAGIAAEVIMGGSPAWAVDPKVREARKGLRRQGCLPTRPGIFRAFCEQMAKRYGTRIDYYEVGNEWDLVPSKTLSIAEALEMQREAYEGLHAGCADVCVTPNGWAGAATSKGLADTTRYNPGLMEAFAEHPELYDAWSFHCHGAFSSYVYSFNNQFLPLRNRTGLKTRPWIMGETALTNFGNGERAVARTVWAKILYAWNMGARDYIWYNLRATGWFEGGEPGYGLITAGFQPRASYAAFAALTTIFQGLEPAGRLWSHRALHLLRFQGEKPGFKGVALAGWDFAAENGPRIVRVKTDAGKAELSDHMGNRSTVAVEDGVVTLALTPDPVALILPEATRAEIVDAADFAPRAVTPVVIPPPASGRAPDFTLDDIKYVRDYNEANPAVAHRIWQGPKDLSARVWLTGRGDDLEVRAEVEDDVAAAGDGLMLAFDVKPGTPFEWIDCARDAGVVFTKRREGTKWHYTACVKGAAHGFDAARLREGLGFSLRVLEDDGEGPDGYLQLVHESEDLKVIQVKQ